jgi:hypothetical protein
MRYLQYAIFVVAIFFTITSANAEIIGKTDEEVRAIAEPLLDTILEGFKTDNYATYSKDFDTMLKESISESKFLEIDRQIQGSIGDYISREYLGFMVKGKMTVILWKGKFNKSEDDVLIKLVVSKRQDKYVVTGLWFQ